MAVLKKGSKGSQVAKLQARLRELGFDAEEVFGPVTELAVRRFQEARGLMPDAIVGPLTRAALEAAEPGEPIEPAEPPAGAGPPVDRSLRLSESQYLQESFPKDLIVLHHTAGASA